jgi:hypothetical protein
MIGEMLKRNRKAMIIQFVIGMAVGAVGALVVLDYGPQLGLEDGHEGALLLALLLVAMGLFITIGSFTRAGAAQMVGAEIEAGEDIAPELNLLRWQGVVSVLAGAELLILGLDPDLLGGPARGWLLPLLLVILAAQTWVNLLLWRRGDEFFRRVISEAGIIGFVAFQFLLFFWTAGVRFGLGPDPEAIDVYVLMMALYLLGSGIAGVRHGYGMRS